MSNLAACDETLEVLRGMGRIESVDSAQVTLVRSLAEAVDAWPSNAQLWKQYREALDDLLKVDDAVDSSLADAIAAIRSAAPVGDTPPS